MARLTARQRAYIKKHGAFHAPSAAELDEELNIVPFLDIVINLIMFLLMTVATVAFFAQVEASLPTYGRSTSTGQAPENPLNLMMTITAEGIMVTGIQGTFAPGCEVTAAGRVFAVPRRGEGYDWDALTACMVTVKREFPDEGKVTVLADPMIHYEHVIHAMDAARSTPAGDELFGEVLLSAGVR